MELSLFHHLKTQPLWILLPSSLGLLLLLKPSLSLLKWLYIILLRPPKNLKNYGSWALITGSTDGIGKAFAVELAKKGLNLILVGRNSSKLEEVSGDILAICPSIRIKNVVMDFSKDLSVGIGAVEEAIKEEDVGVLINNVGVTYPNATYFHELDEEVWMNLVRVNVEGTTKVTKAVVMGMVKRGRGAIVNIGSGASVVMPSHPLYAVYAATKAALQGLVDYASLRTRGGEGTKSIPTESITPILLNAATSCPTLAPMQSALDVLVRRLSWRREEKNWEKTCTFLSQSLVAHIYLSFGFRVLFSCLFMYDS